MLEFIGFLALCFIGYKILKVFVIKNNQFKNIKNFVEIENFCINELNVQKAYFDCVLAEGMHFLNEDAIELKEEYPENNWSSIMAYCIYIEYSCQLELEYGNLYNENHLNVKLEKVNLDDLDDPENLQDYFLKSKLDYSNYTNNEINNLIKKRSEILNNKITHHPSILNRLVKYAKSKNYVLESLNSGIGFIAIDDDYNEYYVFIKPISSNFKEGITPCYFNARLMNQ